MKRTKAPQVAAYGFTEHCWMVECSVCGPLASVFTPDTDPFVLAHLQDVHDTTGVKR